MLPRTDGKFLEADGRRFLVKGVAYGTFAPDAAGEQFPDSVQVSADFAAIAAAGFNTIRTYTVPSIGVLDAAARAGLRVMVGLPWSQHTAFLDDRSVSRQVRRDAVAMVRNLATLPAVLMFAIGNEIPQAVVRWHGARRVERFLRDLYDEIKAAAPSSLLTYVNFPPTEYLDLDCFDVCAFNVYLHRETDLRAYLARLQHIAGPRPLLLAEAGADSLREGPDGQARLTAMQVNAAFAEGACGAVAFSWTDDWWRGGHPVDDWAFGLVDRERRTKPVLTEVARAFEDAPFPARERTSWPQVSVVVCAFNAAETIDDCLSSLASLTYPDVELIVVDDGSRDDTATMARRHAGVRVIDVPHGGLSAARNAGLAAATAGIVAYTDADVRVDPDWLTYLIQPLLTQDVVGVGGPNVVPGDDPWMAQCIARAPGGPTHVLLDDRIAEHVPGCNMAFHRDALLAIGGFNPVFLRAGDDVDICWRLQSRGFRIGFAPAALVWHHHRATIEAFWRQQVGYGEAEAWLNVHHPEKFSGGQMLWRGRIYSPLPSAADRGERRVNTGVWGTAPFPSVYWAGMQPWQFLPHSPAWMTVSTALLVVGAAAPMSDPPFQASWLLLAGLTGWVTTVGRSLALAQRIDLAGIPSAGMRARASRLLYRVTIAWLHIVQPLARMRGRLRGVWSLPQTPVPAKVHEQPWRVFPSLGDARRASWLLAGVSDQRAFWSESWVAHTHVLTELAGMLRASRPAPVVEMDDGWHPDRDLSLAIGHWGWLDLRVLVEEHASGRCLMRAGLHVRVSAAGAVHACGLAALLVAGVAVLTNGRALPGGVLLAAAAGFMARSVWQLTRATALTQQALTHVAARADLIVLPAPEPAVRPRRLWPLAHARAFQVGLLLLLVALVGIGRGSRADDQPAASVVTSAALVESQMASGGGVVVGLAGDLFVADEQRGVIRRLRPRPPAGSAWTADDIGSDGDPRLGPEIPFDAAADIALAPNGDLYIADARHHRIQRIVPSTGQIETVAGSGVAGFSGDGEQARDASLNGPSAVAVSRNGDVYVADTLNNRIRMISHATGRIATIAGDGLIGEGPDVGDSGPATAAHLDRPSSVAIDRDGNIYVADTGHNRVRRIGAATGVIATAAELPAPAGLAVASHDGGVVVYVADASNNRVRVIEADGAIGTLAGMVVTPTRIAYHPAGWLYVKDGSPDGITALDASSYRTE